MFLGRKIVPKATYGLETEKEIIVPASKAKLRIIQERSNINTRKSKIIPKSKVEVIVNEQKSPQ